MYFMFRESVGCGAAGVQKNAPHGAGRSRGGVWPHTQPVGFGVPA